MSEYLSPERAREHYGLSTDYEGYKSGVELQLEREVGIAAIEMPLSSEDFQRLSQGMGVCIEECPNLLADTFYEADSRYGGEVGYVRKEKKTDQLTGLQTEDPKHYFHFLEKARPHWRERFANGPKILRDFLEDGYEIHDAMISVAKRTISNMEATHPNISQLYFPDKESFTFLRLLRYDGYEPEENMSEVAKPHFDIGGVTIQGFADAPGFWGASGVHGDRYHFDTVEGMAYSFLGKGHEKIYGPDDAMKPLWHGVDRIIPAGVTFVPERTAVILFVDAPEVDYHVKKSDTLPHLAHRALVGSGITT